jgi:N-acetylmuramoyl-L-alanine amidase
MRSSGSRARDTMTRRLLPRFASAVLALVVCLPGVAGAQTAQERYETALGREPLVRRLIESTAPESSVKDRNRAIGEATKLIAAYEQVPRRFPRSGYSDNALWQAGGIAEALYKRYGRPADRDTALRMYRWLVKEYPTSSLVPKARGPIAELEALARAPAQPPARPAAPSRPVPAPFPVPGSRTPAIPAVAGSPADSAGAPATAEPTDEGEAPPADADAAARDDRQVPVEAAADDAATSAAPSTGPAVLTAIERALLPGAVRVTLTLDREVEYHEERLSGPERVFFDLRGAEATPPLRDASLRYARDVVREIRTGRHPGHTRVVLDIEGVDRYSVFTLYNPFRLVIEAERTEIAAEAATTRPFAPYVPAAAAAPGVATASGDAPDSPSAGGDGKFSLARQLGLGVSRIVIDPGHGGRDPGARAHGVEEAELVLDVSLRLEKLLQKEPGLEVILTRRTDTYVPLEERTAIANREGADLFLSIHANAARNAQARGIETYYLSFASNPEAEAVAARENAASDGAMHNLPDIVKAIALNNKLDESRDLAAIVQESLVTRLRRVNQDVRNLGVKKAPFVVLIGATMPSVLAEISFLTHRQEAALLKTAAYRQHIAEALHQAIMRYRLALKNTVQTAEK